MSALDIELATMRGFASCSGDYARIDEAEAELAALRGEMERLRAGIHSLAAHLRDANAGVLRSGLRDNADCRRALHELFEMLPNDRE